jgi:integrase
MPDISIGRFRGGFCAYWWDGGKRKRHQLKALTRTAAEAEAIDVFRVKTYRPQNVTVAEIWAAYQMHLGDRPTAETMKSTGKAVLAHFGAYRPDQIDMALCKSYAAKRAKAGRKQGTIHTELGHLRSALTFARKVRMIDRAPHIERPAKPTPKERFLTEAEIRKLREAAHAPHIQLAIQLMLSTAGRVGAILDLTWDRVDFIGGKINLRLPDAVTRKGRAVVPMNAGLRAALSVAKEAALSEFVVEYAGQQVKSIRKGFEGAVMRAGLADVTIHTIRHTAAVHLVQAGVPIDQVAQFLGHSNPSITYTTYARYSPDHLRGAAAILDFAALRRNRI